MEDIISALKNARPKGKRILLVPVPANRLKPNDIISLSGLHVSVSNVVNCIDGGFVFKTSDGSSFNLSSLAADMIMLKVEEE